MDLVRQLSGLSRLRDLTLLSGANVSWLNVQAIASELKLCTQLTRLCCNCGNWLMDRLEWDADIMHVVGQGLGGVLSGLRALERLSLVDADLDEAHALELSCLTKLSVLQLRCCEGVTGMVVAAVAGRLPHLVELDVGNCQVASRAVLLVLGSLSRLRKLDLCGNPVRIDSVSLSMLSGLTALTELRIPYANEVAESDACKFLAGMPELKEVHGVMEKCYWSDEDWSDYLDI